MSGELVNSLLQYLRVMIRDSKRKQEVEDAAVKDLTNARQDREQSERQLRALTVLLVETGVDYEEIWKEEHRQ